MVHRFRLQKWQSLFWQSLIPNTGTEHAEVIERQKSRSGEASDQSLSALLHITDDKSQSIPMTSWRHATRVVLRRFVWVGGPGRWSSESNQPYQCEINEYYTLCKWQCETDRIGGIIGPQTLVIINRNKIYNKTKQTQRMIKFFSNDTQLKKTGKTSCNTPLDGCSCWRQLSAVGGTLWSRLTESHIFSCWPTLLGVQ